MRRLWRAIKKIILSIVLTAFFAVFLFGGVELILRKSGLEVNTGESPFQSQRLFKFPFVKDSKKVDRDSFIETGPRIVDLNSENYRSNYSKDKALNAKVVLAIGDSCTYGLGVNADETFSYYLEKLLNETLQEKWIVYNFGLPGYSSFQGLKFLEENIAEIDPDVVVVCFGPNDGCFAPFLRDVEFFNKKQNKNYMVGIHGFMYDTFLFYRVFKNININFARKLVDKSFGNSKFNFYRVRVSPLEYKENLQKIKFICMRNNAKIIFLQHCWLFDNKKLQNNFDYRPIEPFVSIFNIYKQYQVAGYNDLFADFCHPSAKGHMVIADKLFKFIIEIQK